MLSRIHQCAKFQGHTGWKIDEFNPIFVRSLGRSQLSNPWDLPCLCRNAILRHIDENAKTYTQKLSPSSTNLFGILVTTNSSHFFYPAKTGRYWHGWENSYTSHSIFVIRKGTSYVFRHSDIISSMLLIVTECILLVLLRQLTFVTDLSVTFIIVLVLICRHTLPSVLPLVAIFTKETISCMILSQPHNDEFRQYNI